MIKSHKILKDWKIPEGFKEVESVVEGVLVFAPSVQKTEEETPKTFSCPQCGASTQYDIAAGGVNCEYCGFLKAMPRKKTKQKSDRFEFTLETLEEIEKGWGISRSDVTCESCGAHYTMAAGAITATCPFCASNQVYIRQASSETLRPRFLVPFKVKLDFIRQKTIAWLGKGWFHPDELSGNAVVKRFVGLYLPFWLFSSEIHSNWEAQVGYERQKRYYDSHSKSWKTKTVIDWRWEDGRVVTDIHDHCVNGSSSLSESIIEQLHPFDLKDLVDYAPDYLAGWHTHVYDVNLPEAWEMGKVSMREQARKDCYSDISTRHVRNFRMTSDFSDETWRYVLFPVYLATYRFEDKKYQIMANGQTGKIVGQKPVAWWKVWLAIGGLMSPGFLLSAIGLPLLLAGGIGAVLIAIGLFLMIGGGVLSVLLYRKAVKSEEA
ncbi:MAG: hypothetical protein JEZ06_23695 [Anaerolineaceae bacterium]|nr:hypothetical protein [Anaerolineaceae bacterium]